MGRSLSPGAEEYLSWLTVERGRSAHTLAAYRHDLGAFEAWAHDAGVDASAPGAAAIERYLDGLRSAGLGPATVARATTALRGLFRFLVDEGGGGDDPTVEVRSPRLPRRLPKALTEDEVLALLAAADGPEPIDLRDRALLELLYATGARISEAVGLCLADLNRDDDLVSLFGKGSKERLVPLGWPAQVALDRWLGADGRPHLAPVRWSRRSDAESVFLNARGARLSRQGAWAAVRFRAVRAGLGQRVSPHVLRHSCATHMLAHGADIRVVQELLGHVSIATTQIYTRVSPEHLRRAYEAAHPRAGAAVAR